MIDDLAAVGVGDQGHIRHIEFLHNHRFTSPSFMLTSKDHTLGKGQRHVSHGTTTFFLFQLAIAGKWYSQKTTPQFLVVAASTPRFVLY